MTVLAHQLDRIVDIGADPAVVFRFFTDPARWAAWWGEGSTIDARPGGRVLIRYPGGTEAAGTLVDIVPPSRLVFTYGYVSGKPIPEGSSEVTIVLEPTRGGTRLHLTHAFADADVRDQHVQGWRYQLSLFANAVASDLHGTGADAVDRWFDAWADADEAARNRTLEAIAGADVQMRDRYSCVIGRDELSLHIGAAQRFMPGIRLRRHGEPRQCQGMVLADWEATGPDGQVRATGTSVFTLGADGRIAAVTGFWK